MTTGRNMNVLTGSQFRADNRQNRQHFFPSCVMATSLAGFTKAPDPGSPNSGPQAVFGVHCSSGMVCAVHRGGGGRDFRRTDPPH